MIRKVARPWSGPWARSPRRGSTVTDSMRHMTSSVISDRRSSSTSVAHSLSIARRSPRAGRRRARRTPAHRDRRGRGRSFRSPQSSLVFARDGSLIGEIGREMRTSVPIVAAEVRRRRRSSPSRTSASTSTTASTSIGVAGAIKGKILGENRGGGEHHHAAARRQHASRPSSTAATSSLVAQAPRAGGGARDGEALHQGADPRGVPQPDQLRPRLVRRRSRRRATTSAQPAARAHARRGGDARRRCRSRSRRTIRSRIPTAREGAPQPDPRHDGGAGVHHAGRSPSKTKLEPVVTAPNAGMSARVGLFRRRGARSRPSARAFR